MDRASGVAMRSQELLDWAEIARFVGQCKLSITADTYTHVLVNGARSTKLALFATKAHAHIASISRGSTSRPGAEAGDGIGPFEPTDTTLVRDRPVLQALI
jgi:hypothetical protein